MGIKLPYELAEASVPMYICIIIKDDLIAKFISWCTR